MRDRVRDAYRYCQWIVAHHYENFPVGSWLIPRSRRSHVAAIYAFARGADDFSDELIYRGRGLELLEQWRATLWACANGGVGPQHPIFIALSDTIRSCELPVQLLDDLLTAFRMDLVKSRYADWGELLDYCRYSANPVGRLVLAVFGIWDPKLARLSDGICTGLQLANHWQDLSIDFLKKDRLYVPQELMREHGVSEQDLKEAGRTGNTGKTGENFRALMRELVRRTREQFDQGAPLIGRVSGRLRLELKLTVLGGRAILDRIEQTDFDPFRYRPILSTATQFQLLAHALVS